MSRGRKAESDPCAGVGQPFGSLKLTFATPQNYFGLYGVSNQVQTGPQTTVPGTIMLTTTTGSVSVSTNDFFNFGGNGGAKFVGFTDATGFTSVTISANANGVFGIDDVSFKSPLVTPEPASVLLVAGGLLAVAGVSRRKRSV